MKTTITVTLLIIADISTLSAVGHEDANRSWNSVLLGTAATIALGIIAVLGG